MRQDDIPAIRSLHLFRDMTDDAFDDLLRGAYVQNFPSRVEMITEGDSADFLHVIMTGSAELLAHWNGRETCMATIRPVSTFILAATIRDAPYLMSARTIEKSRIVMIPSQDVRAVFARDADFARAIVTELARCYRGVVRNTKNLKLRTSLERLANYLLRAQNRAGDRAQFTLDTEKRRLASFLGMTPENLSRAFRGLQAHGVQVDGARITVTDRAALENFAKPCHLIDTVPAQSPY